MHGQPNNVRVFVKHFFDKFRLTNNESSQTLLQKAAEMKCCIFGDNNFYCENGSHTRIYNRKSEDKMKHFLNQWKDLTKYRDRIFGKNATMEMKNVTAKSKAKKVELLNASQQLLNTQGKTQKLINSIMVKTDIIIKRVKDTPKFQKIAKKLNVDIEVYQQEKVYLEVCLSLMWLSYHPV